MKSIVYMYVWVAAEADAVGTQFGLTTWG